MFPVGQLGWGNPVKVAGSSQDITERKTNELTQAAITNISESALTSITMEELFKSVHDSIKPVLPARNFFVALYDRDTNLIAVSRESLVDRVVDDLIDQVMKPRRTGRTDVHGGPLADRLETFENLDLVGAVVVADGGARYSGRSRGVGRELIGGLTLFRLFRVFHSYPCQILIGMMTYV